MSSNNGFTRARQSRAMPPLHDALEGRKILLTGATGFLGKVFLYVLLKSHPEIGRVYLLIRGDQRSAASRFRREILDSPVFGRLREDLGDSFTKLVEQKIAILPGDITLENLVADEASDHTPATLDAVVHCAGLVNFEASLEKALSANTLGVANVVRFCKRKKAALLHISTCYAAGAADGHRYEDDFAVDWSPVSDRRFRVDREIQDAKATIARAEAASHDQATLADLTEAHHEDGAGSLENARKRWVEDRLKQDGLARARRWGWPNTYSYSKSLGEQLVFAVQDKMAATVVRPAVIESSLNHPFPGWNQGVNTSAPLAYLSTRGFRLYPARADLVLDVIPVDLVAHAMVPVLAALLLKRHKPIYQLGTSDCNPLTMRRLVELTGLSNRVEQHRYGRSPMGELARHLEAVVVSQPAYELASKSLPKLLSQVSELAENGIAGRTARFPRAADVIRGFNEQVDLARALVTVYKPYIQELMYTFHGANIRALYRQLRQSDIQLHPYAPNEIDWRTYWIDVHMTGLRRHSFPQLDFHTRTSRPVRRFRNLVDMLDNCASRFGSKIALEDGTNSKRRAVTYRELRDRARRGGLMLAGKGIRKGDLVLLGGENSAEWVLGFFSIISAGAVAVPLDHHTSPEELRPLCAIARPKAAIFSASLLERLTPSLRDFSPDTVTLDLEELRKPFLLRAAQAEPHTPTRETVASIVFTSGTTGSPKGVMLTHGNFTSEIAMLSRLYVLNTDDVVLSLLPLHHTFEFTCGMLLPIASGARVVYPGTVDATNLSRVLADTRPTALIGVPALWEAIHRRIVEQIEGRGVFFQAGFEQLRDLNRRLTKDFRINLGSAIFRPLHAALGGRLRLAVSGGSALPPRIASFFNEIGIRLLEGYGLTETAPVLCAAAPGSDFAIGSVGKPLNSVNLRIETDNGSGIGEIVVRGPNVMAGYYKDKAATDAVLRDGWLHTGDLGRIDEDGNVFIVGRAKEVIVDAGGKNIYIDEVEQAYGNSPWLKEVAVVGFKSAGGAEQVSALAVPAYARGQAHRTVQERLREHFDRVSATLSPHKRIRILRFQDGDLPRTRTRKIKRTEVADILRRIVERTRETSVSASADVPTWLSEALSQVSTDGVSLDSSTRLVEDLGLDSLALAEIGEHLTERAGREFSPEELSSFRTVGDLQNAVESESAPRPHLPSYAHLAEPLTPILPNPLKRIGESAVRGSLDLVLDRWLKPRVYGRGNVPANRNLLIVANHASHFDFAVIRYALGKLGDTLVVGAAKDYFFNTPLRRFVASNFSPLISIDRERAQLESLNDALAALREGRNLLIFPEGTRSPDGRIHDFKSGAAYLALQSRCDVLPILIRGTYDVLGKGKLVPRHHQVDVIIGAPVPNQQLREIAGQSDSPGAFRKISSHLRDLVIALGEPRPRKQPSRPQKPRSLPRADVSARAAT